MKNQLELPDLQKFIDTEAEDLKDAVDDEKYGELRHRSVFNYSVKEI